MELNERNDEFEGLPLRFAYNYLSQKNLENESNEIKQSKDKYKSYSSTLRRGKIIDLLEKNNLLEDFINIHWSFGKSDKGKKKIQRYKSIYYSFLNSDKTEDEQEDENIEETSFAYEADLRDYLANNLNVIEAGLKLYIDENGLEGVEYSVDSDNKRIDILAVDKDNILVVIELKVSKGYEKVIGQCLYYKNRIKQKFTADRVRIIIIAREITKHLKVATEDLKDVELYEYSLSVKLKKI
ncbi:MAG: endonuclease NucS domain-containing protein [Peptostreptococcales bacterium]